MEEKREQTSWNIAAEHSRFISKLVHKGINYFLTGDLHNWYWTYKSLREIINHDLTKPEVTFFDNKETEISKIYINGKITKKKEFADLVQVYQRKVMIALKDQGYFPKKEDRTKLSF